jgi:hypothetical protein
LFQSLAAQQAPNQALTQTKTPQLETSQTLTRGQRRLKGRARKRPLRTEFVFVLAALTAGLVLATSSALAADKWYVEFPDEKFDESLVRRAVALELREVDIPGDPRRDEESPEKVSLHIALEREETTLFVSLWDRGEFVGRRRVSSSKQPRVLARRVGLAVGELGRQLAARRYRVAQRIQREAFLADEREKERRIALRKQDLGLQADFRGLILPQGAFLVGPSLGLELNEIYPLRFSAGLSWMAGAVPTLSETTLGQTAPRWSSLELWLAGDWLREVNEQLAVSVGGLLAVSAVHVSGSTEVDEIPFQRDTYTSRAGMRIGAQWAHSDLLRWRADVSGGLILRPIPMRHGLTRTDLGGGFIGLSLGATIAPQRRVSK